MLTAQVSSFSSIHINRFHCIDIVCMYVCKYVKYVMVIIYSLSSIATPVQGMTMCTTRDHGPATISLSDANQLPLSVKNCTDSYPVMLSTELTKSVTSLFSTRDIWVDKSRIQLGKLIREGNVYHVIYTLHTYVQQFYTHKCVIRT